MDHLEKLKEWYEIYKGRHDKAVSMNIDEGSKHYPAFLEIQQRYFALYLTVIFYEDVPGFLSGDKAEQLIKGYVLTIMRKLFIGEIIQNEDGKKEYIQTRVTIKKSDMEKIEAFDAAVSAVNRFIEIDFTRTDQEQFAAEIREDIFHIVNWYLIAREMVFAVNANQRKKNICA